MNNIVNVTTLNNIDHELMQQIIYKQRWPNVIEM
jgi:hypothetical protein